MIAAAMASLCAEPFATLAGRRSSTSTIFEQGGLLDGGPSLPPPDGLLYLTANGGRVVGPRARCRR